MSNRTFRVILVLVALLFLNIEAAQAGLLIRLKVFIHHEFSDFQLLFLSLGLMSLAFIIYVLFTPVAIGNQKSVWLNQYPKNPTYSVYQNKRNLVTKISSVLKGPKEMENT